MLPSPDQNVKIGSVGQDFFFFFLRTVRELSFPIFFLKFLNGENSGGMQSKRIYKSCKCFFKPLNTNFSKFFAQIWHKKKKKKNPTLFFRILRSVGRGQHNKKKIGLIMLPPPPPHPCLKSVKTHYWIEISMSDYCWALLTHYMGQNFERCTIGHFQTLSTSITPGSPPVTQKQFLWVSS